MRNIIICSFGTLVATTALLGVAPAAYAANAFPPLSQEACAGIRIPGTQRCTAVKSVAVIPVPGLMRVVNGRLDRNSCHQLPTKVARDTCLNHVDGSA